MHPANIDNSLINKHNNLPVEQLKSGQLLALSNHPSSGLILQKPYYAEFISSGAALGGMFDIHCVSLHTLGNAEFFVPETLEDRKQAFQKRIADIEAMQKLCQSESPLHRASAVLEMLCGKYLIEEIQTISNDTLAKLVGVLPSTIAMAWQQQFQYVPPTPFADAASNSMLESAVLV
jgi:hypothetical protein